MTSTTCTRACRGGAGFTILEMLVAIIIISTLAATLAPKLIASKHRQELAREVAKNAAMLIDASKAYYVNDADGNGVKDWPADIAALKTTSYVNSAWSATHVFGGGYSLSVNGSGGLDIRMTALPSDVQSILRMSLPGFTYDGATKVGQTTIPIPGKETSLENLPYVKKAGDDMWGDLISKKNAGGTQANVVINTGTEDQPYSSANDRLVMGERSGVYGLHASNGNGDLNLRADATQTSGQVRAQGKGFAFANSSGVDAVTADETGNVLANDLRLKTLAGANVPLSQNGMWVVYTGILSPNMNVTAPMLGGSCSNADYYVFVLPVQLQGKDSGGSIAYPMTAAKFWADPAAPVGGCPTWTVKAEVRDGGNISHTDSAQQMLVMITAKLH